MLTVCYPSQTYTVDTSKFDSQYLQSIVELDSNASTIQLTLFQDIFDCIHTNNITKLFSMDYEYVFKGLSYFGSEDLLKQLFIKIRNEALDKEMAPRFEIEEFFSKYINKSNAPYWCTNVCLSYAFFEQNLEIVDWKYLSQNTSLPEWFFEKYIDKVDWEGISKNTSLSEEFFERHIDRVNWFWLVKNKAISEDFVERNMNKIPNMYLIMLSMNPSLSEEFFERHMNIVHWNYLSENPSITEAFLEKYSDKVDWAKVWNNPSISEEFAKKHFTKIRTVEGYMNLIENKSISEKFIETCSKPLNALVFNTSNPPLKVRNEYCVTLLDIALNYEGHFCHTKFTYGGVSHETIYRSLSEDLILRNISKCRNWNKICKYASLTEKFIQLYPEKIVWGKLCENKNISESTLLKYKKNIRRSQLASNPNVSFDFVKNFIENIPSTSSNIRYINYMLGNHFGFDTCPYKIIEDTTYYSFDLLWKNARLDD